MPAIPYAILGYGRSRAELQRVIDATTYINVGQIRDGRAPLWWNDRAVYRREAHATLPGVERIQTAEELAAMGAGDCDDHAPALAASLQVVGWPARAVVVESPGIGYHVVVVTEDEDGDRRIIDPSARRGMLMGEAPAAKRTKRRQRMQAALTRAGRLVTRAESMAPGAAARGALLSEARRLLDMAHEDRTQLEEEEATATDPSTETEEPTTSTVSGDVVWNGRWSGYRLRFVWGGKVHEVRTRDGVRGLNIPVTVRPTSHGWTARTKHGAPIALEGVGR